MKISFRGLPVFYRYGVLASLLFFFAGCVKGGGSVEVTNDVSVVGATPTTTIMTTTTLPAASESERLVAEGIEHSRQGDSLGAKELYDRAILADPANAEAYAYRGFARIALGDEFGGDADLRQSTRLQIDRWTEESERNPGDIQPVLSRGVAHADLGEYRAALEDYDQILRLWPENTDVYYLRGKVKHQLGDPAGAISDYDTALRLNPKLLPVYLARANAHAALGNHAAAAADYAASRGLEG